MIDQVSRSIVVLQFNQFFSSSKNIIKGPLNVNCMERGSHAKYQLLHSLYPSMIKVNFRQQKISREA